MTTRRSILKNLLYGVAGVCSAGGVLSIESILDFDEGNLIYDNYFFSIKSLTKNGEENNKEFVQKYLDHSEYRMRTMFAHMPEGFWRKHSDEIVRLYDEKHLVFRAKIQNIKENKIEVVNIWSSRKVYYDCFQKCNGELLHSEFSKVGIETSVAFGEINKEEVMSFISKALNNGPYVIEIGAGKNNHIKSQLI